MQNPFLGRSLEVDSVGPAEESEEESEEEESFYAVRRVVSEINTSKFESLFEPEKKHEPKYSLKTATLDRSFMYHLRAVFFMRWGMQKRNRKGIINELLIPALIAFAGLCITKVKFDFKTPPSQVVTPDLLP